MVSTENSNPKVKKFHSSKDKLLFTAAIILETCNKNVTADIEKLYASLGIGEHFDGIEALRGEFSVDTYGQFKKIAAVLEEHIIDPKDIL